MVVFWTILFPKMTFTLQKKVTILKREETHVVQTGLAVRLMMIRWLLRFIYWWLLHQRYVQKDYNLLGSNAVVAGKNLLTFRVSMKIEAVYLSEILENLYHIKVWSKSLCVPDPVIVGCTDTFWSHSISHHVPYNDRLTLEPQKP